MSVNNLKRKILLVNLKNNHPEKDIKAKEKNECDDEVFFMKKESEDLEELAELRVCRICLSIDVNMYYIYQHKLRFMYEKVVGVTLSAKAEDRLPKMLCWECVARLSSANKFRDKAIISQNILSTAFNVDKPITLKDIKSLQHNLNSTLVQEHLDNHSALHINGDDNRIKIEVKNENSLTNDEDEEISDDADDEIGHSKDDDVEIEVPHEYLEIKNENSAILVEDLSDNCDDNECLSDVDISVKRENCEVKESSKIVVVTKNLDKIAVKNPLSTVNRHKTTDVRQNKKLKIDESLFTVTPISYEEQIAEIEKRQENDSYKKATIKCTLCFRVFQHKAKYKAHMTRHDEKSGPFECFVCKSRFKIARNLRNHLAKSHTEKFSCKKCPFTTPCRSTAKRHEQYHSGAKYQCPHCPTEFEKVSSYMSHLRLNHTSKFVCGLCGFTFVSEKGIEIHKKRTHRFFDATTRLEGPYCKECDVRFISEEAHARHLQLSSVHNNDYSVNRIRNDSTTLSSSRERLREFRSFVRRPIIHMRPRGAPKPQREKGPITCEKCGVVMSSQKQYAGHFRRVHPGEMRIQGVGPNPYMCEQCGRFFKSNSQLEDHTWVHTGIKGYQCDICDKSFANKVGLVVHLSAHGSTKRTYDCKICGRNFNSQSNRNRHMSVHSDSKPYKCEVCGKTFRSQQCHKSHIDHIHNNKPWPKRVRHKKTNDD